MNISSYIACAGVLALTLPAWAAPDLAPSAGTAVAGHAPEAGIVVAQGPPPHAQGKGRGGDGGGPGKGRGGGGGGGPGGPAIQQPGGGGGQGAVIQRGGGGPAIRAAPDFRGGADVRVRSRVDVRERWRGDRWRYRYRDRGPRVGVYIAGGRGWCHRHHWRYRVLRHCHPYSYRWHRHGRWR